MARHFAVVPSAYVLLVRDEEVLLQLRQDTGYMDGHWASGAAGHVERGESVFEAAQRESREELGVEIKVEDLQTLCVMHRAGRLGDETSERVDFFFKVTTWLGSPEIAEPAKAADLRWFDPRVLPSNIVPHERYVLDQMKKGQLSAVVSFGF